MAENEERSAGGEGDLRGAEHFLPERHDAESLHDAAARCRGCNLHVNATQVVFGEGPAGAVLMLVGEQPGDAEDREGHPFVGPAGQILDRALTLAGIDRTRVYVTNAVKHFKWYRRGKRRLHARPSSREIRACSPWLAAELSLIQPKLVVCLGATAAQALLGPETRVTRQRGKILRLADGRPALVTVHPSAILRLPEAGQRERALDALAADLRLAIASVAEG